MLSASEKKKASETERDEERGIGMHLRQSARLRDGQLTPGQLPWQPPLCTKSTQLLIFISHAHTLLPDTHTLLTQILVVCHKPLLYRNM